MPIKPFDLIHNSLGREITLTLKSGVVYKGVLRGYDEFTNLVLDDAVEIVEGKKVRSMKKLVLRGTNILFIEDR